MRIFEWLGSLMMIVALIEFVPNPKKAISNIPGVLQTNIRIDSNNHMELHRSIDQKEKRTGKIRKTIRCYLPGYRLVFNKNLGNGLTAANIIPDVHSAVWGVIYLCSPEAFKEMDRYEGIGGGHYEHDSVEVITDTGERFKALTYVAGEDFVVQGGSPRKDYLERILKGAREHKLPEDYIMKPEI